MKALKSFLMLAMVLTVPVFVSPAKAQFFFFENPLIGEAAPDVTLKTTSGQEKSFSSYREGQPSIVFFWATWCPYCVKELKALSTKAQELKEKGIRLILVDLEETAADVQAYLEKNSIQMEVFLDAEGQAAEKYAIMGVPTFFFINPEGKIQTVEHFLPEDYEELLK